MPDRLTGRLITSQRGLTLVEVMITLTIAAILLTWAVPSLQDFIVRNRMSTEVNNFVASLYVARSEAVKRLHNVGVCPSTNGTSCTSSQWQGGWLIFEDTNDSNSYTEGDRVLQQFAALPNRFQIIPTNNTTIPMYAPHGRLSTVSANTFRFRDCKKVAKPKHVVLSGEGRVRTEPGNELDCV